MIEQKKEHKTVDSFFFKDNLYFERKGLWKKRIRGELVFIKCLLYIALCVLLLLINIRILKSRHDYPYLTNEESAALKEQMICLRSDSECCN